MLSTVPSSLNLDLSQVRLQIRALQPQLVTWRRQIHQKPELGFQENLTAAFITKKLKSWGIPYLAGIAETGIVATITGTKPPMNNHAPVLAIRADMDALPIQEKNEVEYKSQYPGLMHACGHDGHVAIALGIAHHLAHHPETFAGTVKLIFQPAEEGPGGAKPMIAAGVLENPDVEAIIGLHLWNNLPVGTVGVRPGALMAAVERFRCVIYGKGGHGAIPQQTIDPVLIAAQVVTTLQSIVSRNINPLDAAVVTVGSLHAGTTDNVIPHQAEMLGTVRYFHPQYAGYFRQRIEQIIQGICSSHGAGYEFGYEEFYPPVINHPEIAELVRNAALEVMDTERSQSMGAERSQSVGAEQNQSVVTERSQSVVTERSRSVETPIGIVPECQTMGGEDMSFFCKKFPAAISSLGLPMLKKS
ncbi:MAG: amidohydrolase [Coleofasciculaceae cyanobacterium SM2_1_6]|nr:amidohydrolase [Coleofasciculaceae cyanobacterium SM2_1_6]